MVRVYLAFSLLAVVGHAAASYEHSLPRPSIITPMDHLLHRRQSIPTPQNLTTKQQQAVYNATCTAASSPQGLANLTADIDNLTANSLAIEMGFQNIGAELAFIDSEKLNGSTLFTPRWMNISQQWTNILWASRDTATDTATQLGSFVDIIMPVVIAETDIPTAVEILQDFQGIIESLAANAKATSDNFENLQANLTAFVLEFTEFAQTLQDADNATIIKLTGQVNSLDVEIASLASQLIGLGIGVGVTIAGTIIGAGAVAAFGFPLFSIGIIIAGLLGVIAEGAALIALGIEYAEDESKLSSLQAQIRVLQEQEKTISQAQSTLANIQNTTVPMMVNQLQAFTNIWSTINGDCEQSIQFLNDSLEEQNFPEPLIFWTTVNQVPCVYEALIPALQNYADGIENSGIPQPTADLAGFTPLTKLDVAQHQLAVQSIVKKSGVRVSSAN